MTARADTDGLAEALAGVKGWPVAHVAGAVVGPHGLITATGVRDRSFRLASVTKLVLAYACLVAVEEGTLDLDESAGPDGSTVRHLLAHASGCGFDDGVLAPPGQRRIYSNVGMDLLARHLADQASMEVTAYISGAVLLPLGMYRTRLDPSAPATGATATLDDLSRFAGELLRPTLVGAETLAVATGVAFPGLDGVLPGVGVQRPNDWGLGFELRAQKAPHWTGATNSPATFGHFGAAGTFLWGDLTINRALVVLTDRAFGPWALEAWPELSDAVVAASSAP